MTTDYHQKPISDRGLTRMPEGLMFSERTEASKLAETWCKENKLIFSPVNIVTGLQAMGYIITKPTEPMNEQEILQSIPNMMDTVRTVRDADYGITCGRDVLLLWKYHGIEMAEKGLNAWMDWVSEQNGSTIGGNMEVRYERHVPAIPL